MLKNHIPWQKDVLLSLLKLYDLCEHPTLTWELDTHALVCHVWSSLFAHRKDFATMEHAGVTRISHARFRRMTLFIEQNYGKRINLEDIAMSAEISKREALRCFQCAVPLSPVEYLNKYRLQQARQLILHTNRSITDIAECTGFESTSYFDRLFKREFHMTPRQQRAFSKAL